MVNRTLDYLSEIREYYFNNTKDKIYEIGMYIFIRAMIGEGRFLEAETAIEADLQDEKIKYKWLWYVMQECFLALKLCTDNMIEVKMICDEICFATATYIDEHHKEDIMFIKKEAISLSEYLEGKDVDCDNLYSNSRIKYIYEFWMWNEIKKAYENNYDQMIIREMIDQFSENVDGYDPFVAYTGYITAILEWNEGNHLSASDNYFLAESYLEKSKIKFPVIMGKSNGQFVREIVGGNRNESKKKSDRLYIQCFGKFDVRNNNGQPASWRTKKAKELMAFLFDKQGAGVSKDTIIEALWNEDEASNTSIFYTTLTYTRSALKN